MEEERARQEAAAKRAAEEAGGKGGEPSSKSEDVTTKDQANVSSNEDKKHIDDMVEENDLLKEALAMSMNIFGTGHSAGDTEMSEATSADQELALGSAITGPIGKECADLWPRIASVANAIV